ncbi:MAG: RNA methyltransferase, partial [Planctomycetota bacterium]|nr:RNA methyltransferase [Planctomycetota bacterium]
MTTPIISELIGYQFHRGVLACGRVPPAATLDELCEGIPAGEAALVVACPDLRDPTNLGTIIRTAAGFGARFLIAGQTGVSPWSRRVLRTSMGSVLTLPIVQTEDWIEALHRLHESGFESVATVLAEDAEPLRKARFPLRRAIFLGNEDAGLPVDVASACRRRVTLPMAAGVDSLNVAVAA